MLVLYHGQQLGIDGPVSPSTLALVTNGGESRCSAVKIRAYCNPGPRQTDVCVGIASRLDPLDRLRCEKRLNPTSFKRVVIESSIDLSSSDDKNVCMGSCFSRAAICSLFFLGPCESSFPKKNAPRA